MKVEYLKRIEISYVLTVEGEEIDRADAAQPLAFVAGIGQLLPAFESALIGLSVGEKFTIDLEPENAYGTYNEEMKTTLPMEVFMHEGKVQEGLLEVGNVIPMATEDGHTMHGTVVEVTDEGVVMDFNHMLAGKKLHFEGEILGVREVTEEEMAELQAGQGCGCGCHDEGCDCDGDDGHEGGCGCGH